jgi:recombination protein RecR
MGQSAQRLAFHLLKTPREEVERLADAMREVKDRVTYCSTCGNITDVDPCYYCTDSTRDHRIICVVEEPENVSAVEKTRDFKGTYHVLMGALSPLHGVGPDDLKIKGAPGAGQERWRGRGDHRDQLAAEGSDRHLPGKLLKPLGVRVTRIAMGVPVGSDLGADEVTIRRAMEGRRG